MFGDKLEAKECITLIDQLKNCKAPFQCAHGRPSVAPIVDLTKLSIIEEEWAILGKKLNFDQVINPVNF
jgi:DNA mismatch repair ATPase MutL